MTKTQRSRQVSALDRLEQTLKSGVTTVKGTRDEKRPLTDSDTKRIQKEIITLKTKLKLS